MRIGNFLKIMAVVTIMAVLYIHLQMQIYALAYQGKKRENKIDQLAEHNVIVKNDILRLTSSDNIGRKLLANEKEYRFAGRRQVVEVEDRASLAESADRGLVGRVMTLAFGPGDAGISR